MMMLIIVILAFAKTGLRMKNCMLIVKEVESACKKARQNSAINARASIKQNDVTNLSFKNTSSIIRSHFNRTKIIQEMDSFKSSHLLAKTINSNNMIRQSKCLPSGVTIRSMISMRSVEDRARH